MKLKKEVVEELKERKKQLEEGDLEIEDLETTEEVFDDLN